MSTPSEGGCLADKFEGRVYSCSISVRLEQVVPDAELGDTDAAMEIGKGLVVETLKVLQAAAEAEGFKVQVSFNQVVY